MVGDKGSWVGGKGFSVLSEPDPDKTLQRLPPGEERLLPWVYDPPVVLGFPLQVNDDEPTPGATVSTRDRPDWGSRFRGSRG